MLLSAILLSCIFIASPCLPLPLLKPPPNSGPHHTKGGVAALVLLAEPHITSTLCPPKILHLIHWLLSLSFSHYFAQRVYYFFFSMIPCIILHLQSSIPKTQTHPQGPARTQAHMSCSLKSLRGGYKRLYRGVLYGV